MFKKTITSAAVALGLCLAMTAPALASSTSDAIATGDWSDSSTWSVAGGDTNGDDPGTPAEGGDTTIGGPFTVTVTAAMDPQTSDDLNILVGGTLFQTGEGIKVDEKLNISGTYDMQGGFFTMKDRSSAPNVPGSDLNINDGGILKASGAEIHLEYYDDNDFDEAPFDPVDISVLNVRDGGTLRLEGGAILNGIDSSTYSADADEVSGSLALFAGSKLELVLEEADPAPIFVIDATTSGDLDLKTTWGGTALFAGNTIITYSAGNSGTFATTTMKINALPVSSSYVSVGYGDGSDDAVTVTLSTLLDGDTDLDGDVDGTDVTVSFGAFNGSSGAGKTWFDGDNDLDGDVDGTDLTTSFGAFTGSGAGNTVPSGAFADLNYDPDTGNVTLDPTGAPGDKITSFALENGDDTFVFGNAILPWNAAFLSEASDGAISDIDTSGTGFSSIWNLGNVMPTGMNVTELEAYLSGALYAGTVGEGSYEFDLVVVPEPGSITLFVIGACGLLIRRRRR